MALVLWLRLQEDRYEYCWRAAADEQFWKGDADFYRQRLTTEALMVFPDAVGVPGKEETVASISRGQEREGCRP
jgi:hypothetical protein